MEMAITLLITAIYVILIKIFFNTEKLLFWIKQRTKKEEPQLSKAVIDNTKMAALITILMITVVLIITFINTSVDIGNYQSANNVPKHRFGNLIFENNIRYWELEKSNSFFIISFKHSLE